MRDRMSQSEVSETPTKQSAIMSDERGNSEEPEEILDTTSSANDDESMDLDESNKRKRALDLEGADDSSVETKPKKKRKGKRSSDVDDSSVEGEPKKKPRGRPRGSTSKPKGARAAGENTGKRKRGRPAGSTKQKRISKPSRRVHSGDDSADDDSGAEEDGWEQDLPDLVKQSQEVPQEFQEFWSRGLERELEDNWDTDDEDYAKKTNVGEAALWTKVALIYENFPPLILPIGVRVLTERRKRDAEDSEKDHDDGLQRRCATWNSEFCKEFGTIITNPIFQGAQGREFLQYVLEYALWRRVGSKNGRSKPDEMRFTARRDDRLLNAIERALGCRFSKDQDRKMKMAFREAIEGKLGHYKFVDEIDHFVTRGSGMKVKNGEDLQIMDLKSIISGWDSYAAKITKPQKKLSSMNKYKRKWNSDHPTRGPVKKG